MSNRLDMIRNAVLVTALAVGMAACGGDRDEDDALTERAEEAMQEAEEAMEDAAEAADEQWEDAREAYDEAAEDDDEDNGGY